MDRATPTPDSVQAAEALEAWLERQPDCRVSSQVLPGGAAAGPCHAGTDA